MSDNTLTIPLMMVFIFWLIGISGNWKRNSTIILFSLISFIMAFQYNDYYRKSGIFHSLFSQNTDKQIAAISFLVCFIISWIGIYILYQVLWKFDQNDPPKTQGKSFIFLQSIIVALVGWGIGVILSISLISYNSIGSGIGYISNSGIYSLFRMTASLMINLALPLSATGIPSFLLPWIIN